MTPRMMHSMWKIRLAWLACLMALPTPFFCMIETHPTEDQTPEDADPVPPAITAESSTRPEPVIIDEIVVRIGHDGGRSALVKSDIKNALDGTPQTLADLVIDALMVEVDALKLRISATIEDAERYIQNVQRHTGQRREDILNSFEAQGYTYNESLEFLRRAQIQAQVFDYRISANPRTTVSQDEAQEFYNGHETLELEAAEVTQAMLSDRTLSEALQDAEFIGALEWSPPFYVLTSELPEDRSHAATAPLSSIVFTQDITDPDEPEVVMWEITRLVNRRPGMPEPFQNKLPDIIKTLRSQKIQMVTTSYYQKLASEAIVSFTYPGDQEQFVAAVNEPRTT